ncbi:FAD-binding oxidoreductase [Geminocystis sp. NIES-3709]|uniref:NAD(P)/FAD-dependent oxidoreductase n=1 Tax=Geminocystis sp. NIES-3709 TaxID=1617448 RepID=UPI0005FCBE2D|nr:FAD-binding oxidoreductase [Geminocystis sp. NIES-3709]BAQ64935.1 sarcosine oxidase [Geminocystis sp. NIES-3709]
MTQIRSLYDVIVIGGGLTGSALSYELAKQNFQVLLLEKDQIFNNATVYSYGGISYWCGSDKLTNQLCDEGINIHRQLSAELEANTEFREIDLLFTIEPNQNPTETFNNYQSFFVKPQLLDVSTTVELEPLINPNGIVGSLRFPQGHVNPEKTILAYQKAFVKLGGKIEKELVISVEKKDDTIQGVKTKNNHYLSNQVILCAGGFSRKILQDLKVNLPIYFSHAQLIKTPPSDIKLSTLVMPATTKRLDTEKQLTSSYMETIWQSPNDILQGDVLEAGAVQFLDGSFCLGQISQIITNIDAKIDAIASEMKIRKSIEKILPALSQLQGQWHNCQVAFTQGMPFKVGKIEEIEGLSLFSGFTSPFVFVPPLARHFANYLAYNNNGLEFRI